MDVRPRVAVIGSINLDLVVRCPALPQPGQTVLAESTMEVCGGKGANQAVAAARAGGRVAMVGRVGTDAFAERLVANLTREGVNCDEVQATADCASGLAVVAVEADGQNSIIVVPGANARVSVDDVRSARSTIESSDVVLLQLEVPLESAAAAIGIARRAGVRVILDPAPAPPQWPVELRDVDLLCPNQPEAAALAGRPAGSVEQAASAARELHQQGARNVAVTLGAAGALLFDGRTQHVVKPFPVTAVDSTAAGDAFAGALAVRWAEGRPLIDAIRFANAAGALAASRHGAQTGIASRDEVEALAASAT